MYCKEHREMIRCNSIAQAECEVCEKTFTVFNAPPLDLVCKKCSEKLGVCQLCGHDIEIKNKEYIKQQRENKIKIKERKGDVYNE